MAEVVYERSGIYVRWDDDGVVIKKNGLTIEIPNHIIEDFTHEFGREFARVRAEIRKGAKAYEDGSSRNK